MNFLLGMVISGTDDLNIKDIYVIQMINDLQSFVKLLDETGNLTRISVEVDPHLEITEITKRVTRNYGPALLFEHVKDSTIPVLINTFGTFERLNLAFQVNDMDEIGTKITKLMDLIKERPPSGIIPKLKALGKLKEVSKISPKPVKNAPCQEVVLEGDQANLDLLPIITCWPEDAGPFITLSMVITKNPENGVRNIGLYRLQKFDSKTLGMHWQLHKGGAEHFNIAKERGEKIPVAIAIGADPVTVFSASAPLPPDFDEYIFSCFVRNAQLEIVETISGGLEVPANSEIVLEGYVDPNEPLRKEGPFGDHTGFYSLEDDYPVFHLERITMKKNPIYITTVVGVPPQEDYFLGYATERIFLPLIRLTLPEVVDYHMPPEGIFHNLVFVSIKKKFPGHARKVVNGLFGLGLMMLAKVIVIVDEDVNIRNTKEAWWVILNNIDPQRDVFFTEGPMDALDHSSRNFAYGSKMGIDATTKWKDEGFTREWPTKIVMNKETIDLVTKKWQSYGITLSQKDFELAYILEGTGLYKTNHK